MSDMFSFEQRGATLVVKVATSQKKDRSFRYREWTAIGGDGYGVRGFSHHHDKVDTLIAVLNRFDPTGWECKHFLAMYDPRHYYAYLTNGEAGINYIYTTTNAPGSGLGIIFSPQLSRKNIKYQEYHHEFGAVLIANKLPIDYYSIDKWDRDDVWKLVQQGVAPDLLMSTLQLMR